MKDLVEANSDKIMNGYDDLTGLRLFMTASMGESHDLSAIYGIMRMGPEMNIWIEKNNWNIIFKEMNELINLLNNYE